MGEQGINNSSIEDGFEEEISELLSIAMSAV